MGKKIGIDLGTTYSCVSYVDDFGTVHIVDNIEGEQTTPSVVYFDPNGSAVVGSTAKAEGAMNPENIIERVKNFMGDPSYNCFVNGTEYSATAVSTLILRKLIADAEKALGDEIEGAIITCPAYFGDAARNATKVAGENVTLSNGKPLKVYQILDEPIAAAVAYGNAHQEDMDKTILVYDLGGGTFDCTVMKIAFHGADRQMYVLTTGGNHQLGGKDWDENLADLFRQKFCDATGCDADEMKNDPESKAWFSENIEKAKRNLTSRDSTSLTVSFNGQKERIEVTRSEFDDATSGLLNETIQLIDAMMDAKGMNMISDIDEIILVGGSTYMPQVSERLTREYNKPISSYEPNKAVAMGAALLAKDCTEVPAAPAGDTSGDSANPGDQVTGGTITFISPDGRRGGFHPICTKSYGLRIVSNGEYKVLNLILKDSPKPAHGSSSDHFPLSITGDPAMVNEVNILVLENDSLEEMVSLDNCQEIYEEEPIHFDGEVPGNNLVSVEFFVDANGCVSLKLTDLVTGRTYDMVPRRLGDEANGTGMDSAKGMTLK